MDAYKRALKLLAIREHTAKELKRKLMERGYESQECEDVLIRLSNEGWLSDMRFAESYIRSRLGKMPEGRQMLISRLREKGCSLETASMAVNTIWSSEDWLKPLSKALEKRTQKRGEEEAIAYFRAKGFTSKEVNTAMEQIKDSI